MRKSVGLAAGVRCVPSASSTPWRILDLLGLWGGTTERERRELRRAVA